MFVIIWHVFRPSEDHLAPLDGITNNITKNHICWFFLFLLLPDCERKEGNEKRVVIILDIVDIPIFS